MMKSFTGDRMCIGIKLRKKEVLLPFNARLLSFTSFLTVHELKEGKINM